MNSIELPVRRMFQGAPGLGMYVLANPSMAHASPVIVSVAMSMVHELVVGGVGVGVTPGPEGFPGVSGGAVSEFRSRSQPSASSETNAPLQKTVLSCRMILPPENYSPSVSSRAEPR